MCLPGSPRTAAGLTSVAMTRALGLAFSTGSRLDPTPQPSSTTRGGGSVRMSAGNSNSKYLAHKRCAWSRTATIVHKEQDQSHGMSNQVAWWWTDLHEPSSAYPD